MNNNFQGITPELPVANVVKTQEYYRDVLGFKIDWLWNDDFGSVSMDKVQLFFVQKKHPQPEQCCYIYVERVEEVYAQYQESGAKIVDDLSLKPWGMREFTIEDVNGHFLRIGQGEEEISEIENFQT